jgi:hypothetical protein
MLQIDDKSTINLAKKSSSTWKEQTYRGWVSLSKGASKSRKLRSEALCNWFSDSWYLDKEFVNW